jgi:hypothetical protein
VQRRKDANKVRKRRQNKGTWEDKKNKSIIMKNEQSKLSQAITPDLFSEHDGIEFQLSILRCVTLFSSVPHSRNRIPVAI